MKQPNLSLTGERQGAEAHSRLSESFLLCGARREHHRKIAVVAASHDHPLQRKLKHHWRKYAFRELNPSVRLQTTSGFIVRTREKVCGVLKHLWAVCMAAAQLF